MTAGEARSLLSRFVGDNPNAWSRVLSMSDAEVIHAGDQILAAANDRRRRVGTETGAAQDERNGAHSATIRKTSTREERRAAAERLEGGGGGRRERRPNLGGSSQLSTSKLRPAPLAPSADLDLFRARAHASRLRGRMN